MKTRTNARPITSGHPTEEDKCRAAIIADCSTLDSSLLNFRKIKIREACFNPGNLPGRGNSTEQWKESQARDGDTAGVTARLWFSWKTQACVRARGRVLLCSDVGEVDGSEGSQRTPAGEGEGRQARGRGQLLEVTPRTKPSTVHRCVPWVTSADFFFPPRFCTKHWLQGMEESQQTRCPGACI